MERDNHKFTNDPVYVVDSLTGLPMRTAFEWHLAQAVRHIERSRAVLALMHMDLDRMASVNALLGPELGDRVLRAVAGRMAGALPSGTLLARLQSDDFAAFLEVPDLAHAARHAAAVVHECRAACVIECVSVAATVSIGIALCASPVEPAASLMSRAERALLEAKIRGRDGFYPGEAIRP